jgi:predicted transcriptional regulator
MTTSEAAKELGVTEQYVRQVMGTKLKGRKHGKPGREWWNVDPRSVKRLKEARGK